MGGGGVEQSVVVGIADVGWGGRTVGSCGGEGDC